MRPPTLPESRSVPARATTRSDRADSDASDDESMDDLQRRTSGADDPVTGRRKSPGPAARFAEGRADGPPEAGADADRSVDVDPADLLELLEDDYARQILGAIADHPRPARELMDICDASRATVYRRLNRLEERNLVVAHTEIHPDGHHRKVFEATLERATIALDGDGVSATVTVSDADPSPRVGGANPSVADD